MSFTSGQILTASQLNTFDPSTKITNAGGTSSAPSYTFNSDEDTGMYRRQANQLAFAVEGTLAAYFDKVSDGGRFIGPGAATGTSIIRPNAGSAAAPTYTFYGDEDTGLLRSAADEIGLATGGTQRLTIKSDGDVGIGTTSPSFPLSVTHSSNDTIAGFTSGDEGAYVAFQDSTSSGNVFDQRIGCTGNNLKFQTAATDRMTILSGGAVGIGTNSPGATLHTNSGSADTVAIFESSDTGAYIGMKDDTSSSNLHVAVAAIGDALQLRANNSNLVRITGDAMRPNSDGVTELGTSSLRWQAVHSDRYYAADSDSYLQFEADGGSGIDGPGFRFVINGSEMFKFARENDSSNDAMLLFGENNDGLRYEKDDERFTFVRNSIDIFQVINEGVFLPTSGDNYFATSPNTGTGNDAEWASTGFGTFILNRNSSLTAEKENITADLGTHLTADMIDQVVPKMWNRTNSPDYPEIGPLAEDMDAISPFLAAHGADIQDGTYQHFLTGINKTAYLSLLVLAVKDLRTRVAALESA